MPPYISPFSSLSIAKQYPDLTELVSSIHFADDRITPEVVQKLIATEFAFATTVNHDGSWTDGPGIAGLIRNGFEPLSCMKNWFDSHSDDKWGIVFWWKRIHAFDVRPQQAERAHWGIAPNDLHLSGCGFKIGEPPLLSERFFRYFSLLRMPLDTSKVQLRWLETHNYRMIAMGQFANYWVNGWDPKVWTYEKEIEYFQSRKVSIDARTKVIEPPEAQVEAAGQVNVVR